MKINYTNKKRPEQQGGGNYMWYKNDYSLSLNIERGSFDRNLRSYGENVEIPTPLPVKRSLYKRDRLGSAYKARTNAITSEIRVNDVPDVLVLDLLARLTRRQCYTK